MKRSIFIFDIYKQYDIHHMQSLLSTTKLSVLYSHWMILSYSGHTGTGGLKHSQLRLAAAIARQVPTHQPHSSLTYWPVSQLIGSHLHPMHCPAELVNL